MSKIRKLQKFNTFDDFLYGPLLRPVFTRGARGLFSFCRFGARGVEGCRARV